MRKETDLTVRLHLRYRRGVPSVILTTVLDLIERQIYEVEIQSLSSAAALFPEIPRRRILEAADQLRRSRRRALLLVEAAPGSMVLTGVVCALGIWLLNQTLGETVKAAWKRAPLHSRLVDFLAKERPRRVGELQERIKEELVQEAQRLSIEGIIFSFAVRGLPEKNEVRVIVQYRPTGRTRNAGPSRSRMAGSSRPQRRREKDRDLNDI